MEGLYAFETTSALRAHFGSSYDFVKYNGKLKNITARSFAKRIDQFKWVSLERRYGEKLLEYVLCNMIADPMIWIDDLNSVKAEKRYLEWRKWRESMTYKFKQELADFKKEDIQVVGGKHPEALKQVLANKKHILYLVGLDLAFNIVEDWNANINDPIVWPQLAKTVMVAKKVLTPQEQEKIKLTVLELCDTI